MSHHINNDFVIDKIESIEIHEIRGGVGDVVLARWEGAPASVRHLEPAAKPLYRPPHNELTYFQCTYCDVIQKEFHSNCPRCGAPMEAHEQTISKAIPFSGAPDSGASYGMASVVSSGVYQLS